MHSIVLTSIISEITVRVVEIHARLGDRTPNHLPNILSVMNIKRITSYYGYGFEGLARNPLFFSL